MKPLFHPQLVNDPFGDPALYIDYLFEKRALMFDLGNIEALATRKVLRVSHIFVSHAHMDHFIGFDRVLRLCLGREKALFIYGPPGFVAQVENKLGGYTWNLVHNYETDFTVIAVEIHPGDKSISARFRCRTAFKREDLTESTISDGILIDEEGFRIRTTPLDHKTICLAFVLEEKQHINVWKNRLDEMGLPTGPWLRELKKTILRGEPDSTPYRVWWRENQMTREQYFPLGELKEKILHIVPGQKIGYVVDSVYHAENIIGCRGGYSVYRNSIYSGRSLTRG